MKKTDSERRIMTRFNAEAEIGAVKLFTEDTAFFFKNGVMDGCYEVIVYEGKVEIPGLKFVNTFDVCRQGVVHISSNDCTRDKAFTFTKTGRYIVYRDDEGNITIVWYDNQI